MITTAAETAARRRIHDQFAIVPEFSIGKTIAFCRPIGFFPSDLHLINGPSFNEVHNILEYMGRMLAFRAQGVNPPVHPPPLQVTVAIVGPFGPAQLTCMRSWKNRGMRVVFIHLADEDLDVWFIRKFVNDYMRLTHQQFMQADGGGVCDLLAAQQVDGVAALSYATIQRLHALTSSSFWPNRTTVWATPEYTVSFLDSKCEQITLAKTCGLTVAPTAYLANTADAESVSFEYPWVVRPDGSGAVVPAFKVEFIASATQWGGFYKGCKKISKPLIAQPMIDGVNVVIHGARSAIDGSSVHSAFEASSMLDGVTLTLTPALIPDDLINACRDFVEKAGIVGVYHFDFRRSSLDGRFYFLEINGRLGGTTGKVFRLNYDEPWLLVLSFTGQALATPQLSTGCTVSNRFAILRAMHLTLSGRLTAFDYPHRGLLRRLTALGLGVLTWRDEIFYRRGLSSGLIYLLDSLRRRFA